MGFPMVVLWVFYVFYGFCKEIPMCFERERHTAKALCLMLVTEIGRSTCCREAHPAKDTGSMLVTEFGIPTSSQELQ